MEVTNTIQLILDSVVNYVHVGKLSLQGRNEAREKKINIIFLYVILLSVSVYINDLRAQS